MRCVEWTVVDESALNFVVGFGIAVTGWLFIGGIINVIGGAL